jgi:trimeric autotransporter adhesin
VLEKVARMPITSWSYKAEQPSIRHIGPMAQDFYSAFGLGLDDEHISTIDEGGVALAAIQGLYRQNTALQRQNRTLRAQLAAQNARLTRLERALSELSQ